MSIFEKIKSLISIEEEEEEALDTMVPTTSAEKEYGSFYGHAGKNKVVNIHTTTQLQVVLVKPERYESATEIADHLKERRTVVVNMESTNKEAARRILDFLTGVTYANDGNFKRVSNGTYIITPYNVDLKGDLIDELENNGVYF